MKFCSGGEKMRNACFHQGKNERREKQKKKQSTSSAVASMRPTEALASVKF